MDHQVSVSRLTTPKLSASGFPLPPLHTSSDCGKIAIEEQSINHEYTARKIVS